MVMETIDKICCNCHHYRLGQLESPCKKGNRHCGYLHEGCNSWKRKGEIMETPPSLPKEKPRKITERRGGQRRRWSDADDSILRVMYSSHSIRMIEVKLNRSRLSIYQRAKVLGLKR